MLIELQDLGKSFGEHEVLKHVTASVERGDRIGIIGANGTGKTTLLRVLCGESLPDAGDAAFAAGATCGYLEQTGHLDPEKDVYETMRLAFQPALDAMAELETLQKQLAADHHNTAITDKITACNAVIDAMDAYNMDTQIKKVLNGMKDLLPQRLIPVVLDMSYVDENKFINQVSREERHRLLQTLKHFVITISATRQIAEAIVTAGGVSVKEIDPKTMESKRIKGLYFAGEGMDVDGYTGGYNLQAAFSSGHAAGEAAAAEE